VKQERAEKMARRKKLLKDKALQQDRIRASIDRAESKRNSQQGKPDDT
jgi:hypothetical protein